jgi:hypothetical protein
MKPDAGGEGLFGVWASVLVPSRRNVSERKEEPVGSWRIVAHHVITNYQAIKVTAKALRPQGVSIGR